MIQLEPITPKNHEAIRQLAVRDDQRRFVASVEKSLADAYVWADSVFRAAYADDVAVGYVLLFPFVENDRRVVNIVRLMIDARFQGRGMGRELLRKVLDWVRGVEPAVDLVRISTLPENEVALGLYQSEGFEVRGDVDGETVLYRAP